MLAKASGCQAFIHCISQECKFLRRTGNAVVLSSGRVLRIPLRDLQNRPAATLEVKPIKTLAQAERDHILVALKEADWVLAGPHGAAARLGLNRSTLQFRMRKLGIVRPDAMWVGAEQNWSKDDHDRYREERRDS